MVISAKEFEMGKLFWWRQLLKSIGDGLYRLKLSWHVFRGKPIIYGCHIVMPPEGSLGPIWGIKVKDCKELLVTGNTVGPDK